MATASALRLGSDEVRRKVRPPVPRAMAARAASSRREITTWPAWSFLKPEARPSASISGTGSPRSVPTPTVWITTPASRAFVTAASTSPSRSSPSDTSTITLWGRVGSTKSCRPAAHGLGERAARRGEEARLDAVEEEADGIGVEGEGHEGVGLALEGHETEAVAVEA